jgi:hypothetical protein
MYKIKHAPYSRDAIVAYNNETIYPCLFMLLPMDTQRFEPDRATTTAVVHRSLHTQSLHRQIPRRGFHYTRPIKQHSAELKQQQPRKGISSLPLTSLRKHTSIPSPRFPCRELFEHSLNLAAEPREFGTDYYTTSPGF